MKPTDDIFQELIPSLHLFSVGDRVFGYLTRGETTYIKTKYVDSGKTEPVSPSPTEIRLYLSKRVEAIADDESNHFEDST